MTFSSRREGRTNDKTNDRTVICDHCIAENTNRKPQAGAPAWEQIWALLLYKWIFYGLFTRWIYKIDSGDLGKFPSVVPGYGHVFFSHIASHKEAIHNSSLPDNIAVHPMGNTMARHWQFCSSLWWVCEHWTLTEQQAETQITSAVTVQWTMSSASHCKALEVHLGLFLCLDCLVYRITIEATKRPEATLVNHPTLRNK